MQPNYKEPGLTFTYKGKKRDSEEMKFGFNHGFDFTDSPEYQLTRYDRGQLIDIVVAKDKQIEDLQQRVEAAEQEIAALSWQVSSYE